jgi:hypothetical protein
MPTTPTPRLGCPSPQPPEKRAPRPCSATNNASSGRSCPAG